jgi:hypothetical protein
MRNAEALGSNHRSLGLRQMPVLRTARRALQIATTFVAAFGGVFGAVSGGVIEAVSGGVRGLTSDG